jgi:acyl carrier protein
MTNREKISLIEETLEQEPNSLNENSSVDSIENFDSMAKLTLIVLCDDEFNKKLTGEQLREFKTIKDILDFMD